MKWYDKWLDRKFRRWILQMPQLWSTALISILSFCHDHSQLHPLLTFATYLFENILIFLSHPLGFIVDVIKEVSPSKFCSQFFSYSPTYALSQSQSTTFHLLGNTKSPVVIAKTLFTWLLTAHYTLLMSKSSLEQFVKLFQLIVACR
jgi:hypothetical protein